MPIHHEICNVKYQQIIKMGQLCIKKIFFFKKKNLYYMIYAKKTSIFNADVYGFQVRNPLILLDVLKVIL